MMPFVRTPEGHYRPVEDLVPGEPKAKSVADSVPEEPKAEEEKTKKHGGKK